MNALARIVRDVVSGRRPSPADLDGLNPQEMAALQELEARLSNRLLADVGPMQNWLNAPKAADVEPMQNWLNAPKAADVEPMQNWLNAPKASERVAG